MNSKRLTIVLAKAINLLKQDIYTDDLKAYFMENLGVSEDEFTFLNRSIEINEVCPHCDIEANFKHEHVFQMSGIEVCPSCNKQMALCSVCAEGRCGNCVDGSLFTIELEGDMEGKS